MNTPDTTTLATLQTNLAGPLVGNCSNETNLAPPTYATCDPPAASSTYNASDWTAVVNEMLSEAYDAEQVVDQFNDLNTIRQRIFESESGTLPAIANELQLAGAAGNTASFNLQGFFGGASGIAASIAGAFEGGAQPSAGLWVASELISMLPSASDTANSSFQTTYAGLLDKFAAAQDEMSDQWSAQLQQVLGDQGLLRLVGQLRSRRTWKLDINGMVGASREAFALHIYHALLPTMYQRYVITNCVDTNTVTCDGTSLPSGAYVTNHTSTSATFLGPADANPCATYYGPSATTPTSRARSLTAWRRSCGGLFRRTAPTRPASRARCGTTDVRWVSRLPRASAPTRPAGRSPPRPAIRSSTPWVVRAARLGRYPARSGRAARASA